LHINLQWQCVPRQTGVTSRQAQRELASAQKARHENLNRLHWAATP
jgi:hypothetical protein